jgi:hypothetical protein
LADASQPPPRLVGGLDGRKLRRAPALPGFPQQIGRVFTRDALGEGNGGHKFSFA